MLKLLIYRLARVAVFALITALPASALAVPTHYVLTGESTISPTGGSALPLSGGLTFHHSALCMLLPGELPGSAGCPLDYRFDDLELSGAGLVI